MRARAAADLLDQEVRRAQARQLVLARVHDQRRTADVRRGFHHHRAQPVDLADAFQRHPAVVEILAALELGLDDRAQLLVLDAERVLLLDLHRRGMPGTA